MFASHYNDIITFQLRSTANAQDVSTY